MVDFSKLTKNSKLGDPPSIEEVQNNLELPEIFENPRQAQDGRTLRKTERTHQISTRVTLEFYQRLRVIAARDRLKIVEVIEKAIEIYESSKTNRV